MIFQEQLPMVAIPSMNDTHLEEMLIVNRLDTAARSNDVEAVPKILQELIEHTNLHFINEEELMKEALFPDFAVHKGEHDRHLHELNALTQYFDKHKDTKAISVYIEGNLEKWLVHHIQTMDTMTAQFLEQGSTTASATKGCTTENC